MSLKKRSSRLLVLGTLVLGVAVATYWFTSDLGTTLVVLAFLVGYVVLEGVFWGSVAWLDGRNRRA